MCIISSPVGHAILSPLHAPAAVGARALPASQAEPRGLSCLLALSSKENGQQTHGAGPRADNPYSRLFPQSCLLLG